jgi:hypothetical protein
MPSAANPTFSRPRALLSARAIAVTTLVFVAVVFVANRIVRLLDHHYFSIDRPPFWPIGEMELVRPGVVALFAAAGCVILFSLALTVLAAVNFHPVAVGITALGLVIATNSIHGIDTGWTRPIAGGDGASAIQYYHDSLKIKSLREWTRDYTAHQTALLAHARTHPPGAVTAIHLLRLLLGRPANIAAAIALVSLSLLTLFGYGLLRGFGLDPPAAGYATFLLLLIPALQIYSLASVDAVISAMFLGTICLLIRRDRSERGNVVAVFGTAVCLFLASWLTFASLFLPPVMLAAEWGMRRSIKRTLGAITLVVAGYTALFWATGFKYWECFRLAAGMENPQGYRLISQPASFLFTRLECVLEILLFFGPFLMVLALRGTARMPDATKPLFWSAVLTLLAMFGAGAFHTGETARACQFIYPFLMIPVAAALRDATLRDKTRLAAVVFAQALFMQLLGDYFW